MVWVVGRRDGATFQHHDDKVKYPTTYIFYSDDQGAFAKVLPRERHIIGKGVQSPIERQQ